MIANRCNHLSPAVGQPWPGVKTECLVIRIRTCWLLPETLNLVAPVRKPVSAMPSLFRFLAAVAIIVAIVYGGMIALTVLVQPQSREISVTIPQDRFSRQR